MFFSCGWCYKYKTAVEILWNFYQTEEENELVQSAQVLKKVKFKEKSWENDLFSVVLKIT